MTPGLGIFYKSAPSSHLRHLSTTNKAEQISKYLKPNILQLCRYMTTPGRWDIFINLHLALICETFQPAKRFICRLNIFLDELASLKPHIVVQNRRIRGALPENPGCIAENPSKRFQIARITLESTIHVLGLCKYHAPPKAKCQMPNAKYQKSKV